MSGDTVRIGSLDITDYRGIRRFTHSFEKPGDVLVLGGPNGSGKTSVLEAALLAMGADNLIERWATDGRAVRKGAEEFRIEARTSIGAQDLTLVRTHRGFVDATPKVPQFRTAENVSYFPSRRSGKYVGPMAVTAGRRGRKSASDESNRLPLLKQYLINAKAHSLIRGGKLRPTGDRVGFAELTERLEGVWRLFHRGSGTKFIVDEVSDDPSAGFDVFLDEGTRSIPLDQLSSGQQEIVGMFGSLILGGLDGGLIVIDEPELHLDQSWHRVIVQALRKTLPRSQFLMGTHSPEIFDSVYSFQRVFLGSDMRKLGTAV